MASRLALLFAVAMCACGPSVGPSEDPQPTSTGEVTTQPASSSTTTTSGLKTSSAAASSSDDTGPARLHDLGVSTGGTPSCAVDGGAKPSAMLVADGTRIELSPSGIRFAVPALIQESSSVTFLLSEDDRLVAENDDGEWTTEYAAVANALLPFDRCGAHFGDDAWPTANSFLALWTRAYIFEESIADLEASFIDNAAAAAEATGGTRPQVSQKVGGPWRQTRVTFDLSFGDYGGGSTVEMQLREYGGFTLGFVFMHPTSLGAVPDPARAIDEMLYSVCVPAGVGGCCDSE